jgi:hypothetical protein
LFNRSDQRQQLPNGVSPFEFFVSRYDIFSRFSCAANKIIIKVGANNAFQTTMHFSAISIALLASFMAQAAGLSMSLSFSLATIAPTTAPSLHPTVAPSTVPTLAPSTMPTAAPSTMPSAMPTTASPTAAPSFAPASTVIQFNATVGYSGTNATYMNSNVNAQSAARQATATSMGNGVTMDEVLFLGATATSRRHLREEDFIRRLTAESCNVAFSISAATSQVSGATDAASAYAALTTQLNNSVNSGAYATSLSQASVTYNVPALQSVNATGLSTTTYTTYVTPAAPSDNSNNNNNL